MYLSIRILWVSIFAFSGLTAFSAGFPVGWGTSAFGLTNPPASISNAIAIAAGAYHNLAVLENRTVAGWGDNTLNKATPPAGLAGVVAVAGGENHSLALRQNGRVVAWGDGTATNVPAGLVDAMRIAAGQFHSLALRSNGTVVAWGNNNQGQATPPVGLSTVTAIAAGGNHCLALRANGTVVAWGQNSFGQINVPLNLSGVIAVAAGDNFSMALRNNGTIAVWGNIAAPPAHSGVVAIAAGGAHGIALRSDRTVFCWGDNSLNQSTVPPGTANIIAIAGGATHTVALRMAPPAIVTHPTPRSVLRGQSTTFNATFTGSTPLSLQWRQNNVPIPNATNASYTIASAQPGDAGNYTIFVSNAVGTAQSTNALLTVNVPAGITGQPQSQQVAAGSNVTFTVTAEGTAPLRYTWQKASTNIPSATTASYSISNVTTNHAGNYRCIVSNSFGAATSLVATLTVFPIPTITAQPQSQTVLAGSSVSFTVVASDATGFQWRKNNTDIAGANDAVYTIATVSTGDAGSYRVVVTNQQSGVTSVVAQLTVEVLPPGESSIVQWGEDPVFNGLDQVDIAVPSGLIGVPAMAAGAYHDLVLLRNGRVFGWGDNLYGQASSPSTVTNARAISAGMHHSVALTSNGTVVAWGRNNFGQTEIPAGLSNVAAIAAGGNHTLALRSNGTVVAWGHTNAGQATVPSNATNVIAIAAGFEHSIAVRSNGTLRTWGNNDFGQRVPPFPLSNLVAVAAGKYHSVALRNDGRVFAWGQNTLGQTNVPAGLESNVVAIAAGDNHSIALRSNGSLVCWGQNNFLQLQPPDGLGGVMEIAAGGNRSLARKNKLRLAVPERFGNGIRLRIANTDGSPMDSAQMTNVQVYVSPDPALPLAQWTRRDITFSVVNGTLQGDDLAPLPKTRFYIAILRP